VAYPDVDPQPDFPAIERGILEFWERDGTFRASIDQREAGEDGANEYVFYDGPPFANGLPHYGHLLTGFVKDAVPRYQTMRGRRVERRFGWDCHGLPAEAEAERQLGISGRQAIEDFGVGRFNEHCRSSVLQYTSDWERYVTRQARWVDFANDYKTLDTSYMESVMWAFKRLWDKGLIYEGFRVLPYSWALETPLSNTETRMDDAYREVQDPALTVGFRLEDGSRLLAWTTTPWTLPSNLALAVAPDVDYVRMTKDGDTVVLAAARAAAYARELDGYIESGRVRGAALVGMRYEPLFPWFTDREGAFRVLSGDFVTTEDGTGVVHMAPGFGEDDQRTCAENGIDLVVPVDSRGRFTAEVPDYEGMLVFDANPLIARALKERGAVVRHESYVHSYPHCWRTGTPLIYRAVSSWFVDVTAVKQRMVELNRQIRWVPDHLRDGSFGKWLANARDWTISRNRFWGAPIPVWKSDDPAHPRTDVYGSIEELERDFGPGVADLHRPAIDDLVRPNPDDPSGRAMMRRVPEVLDCWFESGSMPFAQVHYPFENREWFDQHYPGDFIVEYIGQTRGWFYTLHVLATALFDRPAFSTCVSHGIVLGDDGQKMSKSRRNYPDPMGVFEQHGADAMRWYLLSSSILRGADFSVTEEGIRDTVRQVILPLWNSWYFLSLYARAEGRSGRVRTDSPHRLDRYVLAKTGSLVSDVTEAMDAYDLFGAASSVREFLDVLTNWYIRRSRDRFWSGDQDAIDTLHTVLEALTRLVAPLLPLTAEAVYRGLTGERSVHLADWPVAEAFPSDDRLVAVMDEVRSVCSAALSLRKAHGRRVRQPLRSLHVATPLASGIGEFEPLIRDEVNVRTVTLSEDVSGVARHELRVVPARLGPRLGAAVQQVIAAVKRGDWTESDGSVSAGGHRLEPGEYELLLAASSGDGTGTVAATLDGGRGIVLLDVGLDDDLIAEGAARDLVRVVQQARRTAGLSVTDRIVLRIGLPDDLAAMVAQHRGWVAGEVLAARIVDEDGWASTDELDGRGIFVAVDRIP